MKRLSTATGRPITFALLQNDIDPSQWRRLLDATEAANQAGARLVPQVSARPTGLLIGLDSKAHPFTSHASYREIAGLPLAERVQRLRDPELRRRILAETATFVDPMSAFVNRAFHKLFRLGNPPDYEPSREESVAAIAARTGKTPEEVAYDILLERDGHEFLYLPVLNYSNCDFEPIREMLTHPLAILGLSDGGAHCGLICDAGMPTMLLTHWVRDRSRGERLPLEAMIRMQTRRTSELYGLLDRGLLAPGMKADVNLIDFDELALLAPEMVYDLPANGRRLIQKARGYRTTIKSGTVIFNDGEPTGEMPGQLLRGPQAATRAGAA
jgi:N-acyl-D-aspartate/D-glutamate deacylase